MLSERGTGSRNDELSSQRANLLSMLIREVPDAASFGEAMQHIADLVRGQVGASSMKISYRDHQGREEVSSIPQLDDRASLGIFADTPPDGVSRPNFLETLADAGDGSKPEEVLLKVRGEVVGVLAWVPSAQYHDPMKNDYVRAIAPDIAQALHRYRREAASATVQEDLQKTLELISGCFHDLGNVLTAVSGFNELGDRVLVAQHADRLMELLYLYKQLIEHRTVGRSPVRVSDIFSKILAHAGVTRGKAIDTEILLGNAPDDDLVNGNPQLLETVFENILLNALAFVPSRSGRIAISISKEPGSIHIVIEDNGSGIPEDVKVRLFHHPVTRRKGGHGDGLMMVQRIIELHKGSINVESQQGEGSYTRFHIYLPALKPAAE